MHEPLKDDRTDRQGRMRTISATAVRYLAPTFALGWVLGPVREMVFVPRYGRTAATALEAVVMAAATDQLARRVSQRLGERTTCAERYAVGALAFAMLCPLELLGARWVRRIALREYLSSFTTPSGAIAAAMFAWFALAPGVVGIAHPHHAR